MYTCRQHLVCEHCQRARARRLGVKIRKGLEAAAEANPELMAVVFPEKKKLGLKAKEIKTLNKPDENAKAITVDDMLAAAEADRRALGKGWRRFYKAYHRRFGAFPYVGTHEITPGRDGLGHPHAHVVALWPFRDWGELAEMWREACPESTRINFEASRSVKGAARYVSKYISKGVQTDDFSPELRARVVCGTYGTRWLMSSVGFWQPFVPVCPCCMQPIVRVMLRDPWNHNAVPVDWSTGPPVGESGPSCQLSLETLPASD